MKKNFDVIALGELLIDFTEAGKSENGNRLFEQNPGGAPANFLTAASHNGLQAAMIGKVGKDMHGDFLRETLEKEGIDTSMLISDPDVFTTLAFVALNPSGERTFSFARKPGADTCLAEKDLDLEALKSTTVFHFGSLSLTDEPAFSATVKAVSTAKKAGALISFDPNYRASLWESPEKAREAILKLMPYADFLKVSDEESELITGMQDQELAAKFLLSKGPKFVATTLGKDGVRLTAAHYSDVVPGFNVTNVVDTTGAGDAFWGGFISRFLQYLKAHENMTKEVLIDCAVYGNATAALGITKRGGIPSVPQKADVEAFIRMHRA